MNCFLQENSIICEKGDWQWSEKLESEISVVLRQMDESWGRQAEASRAAHLAQAAALAAQSQAQLQEQLAKFHLVSFLLAYSTFLALIPCNFSGVW
jgi:hypothetical protein